MQNLETVYNKTKIKYSDIRIFDVLSSLFKSTTRDRANMLRESIIGAILNIKIPDIFYLLDEWKRLRRELNKYIETLGKKRNIIFDTFKCIHKAGRGNQYDFDIILNNIIVINVEFKFNAISVIETPQFVSIGKPSRFLNTNFEEYYYDNYLPDIAKKADISIPDRDTYIKTVGRSEVECMKCFKEKYDTDKDFNLFCKKIDKQAIKEFIQMCDLDVGLLSDYLSKTQTDKIYMCYKDNCFHLDEVDPALYIINKVIKKEPTNFICETNNGHKLEVKLRFKNGCGLQFPALQIKRKIPTVKQLRLLCTENKLPVARLKKQIIELLDSKNIRY
tara:strand:+ start:5128 stop:6123 length:996 start_codon:yes stop_codon:yes gene_type:complete